ncbi:DUF3040 domain-containing protein [Saccharopolyspora sp. HNM0986]|uniref:DUF3040 domain-containing protein n=1 Tax=Saccharopolyspora galaxeae TaxID=2781241 RepID=UPI00190DCE6F|nr:DUF3040 domain-containing protein [Saccharopolyspora sp. HNM0986]MBK0869782.1 DUF3040 domain-containing protein [Saccharopolyspora sp. HNM0986]
MLPRDERRRIEQIEKGLSMQDPEFADRLRQAELPGRSRVRLVLGVASAVLAVLCMLLGEVAGFLLTGVLAALLLSLRGWRLVA